MSESRRLLFPPGYVCFTVGGGVVKVQVFVCASAPPFADFVPAGTVTEYCVAIGKRTSGSNNRVRVPIQCHLPGGCGESLTGTFSAASSCELTATIGCENVTLRLGAIGTSPSGDWRTTSSGPLGF